MYTAREFTYDGKTLDLHQASPTCLVAPVLNNPEVSNWSWVQGRAFGGLATLPPCPALSVLRGSPGFKSKAADPWKQIFSASRCPQTPFILIENVSGILAHLGIVKDVMRICGHRLASSRVCDLSDFAPVKRSRWFGLFMRQHMRFGPKFIGLCHAVQPKEWPTEDLQIPEDVKEILSNPVYTKGTKTRNKHGRKDWYKSTKRLRPSLTNMAMPGR